MNLDEKIEQAQEEYAKLVSKMKEVAVKIEELFKKRYK